MKTFLFAIFLCLFPLLTQAGSIEIELVIPELDVSPYHRPYVALWLETPDRQGMQTIVAWYEKDDWLKDMRQWWRKLGRKNPQTYDAVTGPTHKPGKYKILWNTVDHQGNPIPKGEYYLCLEAAREAGGRDFLRQKIILGNGAIQTYSINGDVELGTINITIHP
jgi:hypothetical protein